MEYFDILDANGNTTGKTKLRHEVHRDGDWHRAVHIWIMNDDFELLLQKRSPNKDSSPNLWDISCGGHVSAGETVMEASLKEVREEIGLEINESDLEYLFTLKYQSRRNNDTFINNEFAEVFLVRLNLDLSKLTLQEEEVSEVKFIPYQELEKRVGERENTLTLHIEEYDRLFELLHSIDRR